MSSSRQERLISSSALSDRHAIDQICGPVINRRHVDYWHNNCAWLFGGVDRWEGL